jgi:3-oxoacyl-[acyl-carrier protein] reductase
MYNFANQTAIITGGTRGIGRGISEAFLAAGANIIVTYAGNETAARQFAEENAQYQDRIDIYKFNVASDDEVNNFFKSVQEKYESVEILVNNSGIRKDAMVAMMESKDWEEVIDINLKGTFLMSKGVIPVMLSKRYGRIINISSIGGELGLPGQANYAASKAGQVAISKSLSKELGKKKITVNNVAPGFIETELINDLPPELIKEYKKQVPLKRFGTVAEVAHAVLFLASQEASYITGTTIEVSGGL